MSQFATCQNPAVELQVSSYDRMNAWLIAALVVASVLVMILATMLLRSPEQSFRFGGAVIVEPDRPEPGGDSDPIVDATDLQTQVIDLNSFAQVDQAIAETRARNKKGVGKTTGIGDPRLSQIQEQEPALPAGMRWSIAYELTDPVSYSQQLRFFKIDIGVVHSEQTEIKRLQDVGDSNVVVDSTRELESDSTYFLSTDKTSKRWDRALVGDAGLELENRLIVHFYPQATLTYLAGLEAKALPAGKTIKDVAKTRFTMKKTGNGYSFEVKGFEFK